MAQVHLRLAGTGKMYAIAREAKPGGKRPRRYWIAAAILHRGIRLPTVRVAFIACCNDIVRFDESARFKSKIPTCPKCGVISDFLLERGFSKPLTSRRLNKIQKEAGFYL